MARRMSYPPYAQAFSDISTELLSGLHLEKTAVSEFRDYAAKLRRLRGEPRITPVKVRRVRKAWQRLAATTEGVITLFFGVIENSLPPC